MATALGSELGLPQGSDPALTPVISLAGARDAPIVAALGGISATQQVCDEGDTPGWWREIAGVGRALDPSCVRILGWTYPTPAGRVLSTRDHARLLVAELDRLGIARLDVLVGASYGGMVGLALAQEFPERLKTLVAISAAHCAHPLATAWRAIQRRIVRLGLEHDAGRDALVLARALAMTTYRSREEFAARFAGPPEWDETRVSIGPGRPSHKSRLSDRRPIFPVERYLLSRGEDYAQRTSPERFLALSEALDLHRVEPERIHVPAHFVAVRQDQLVPLEQMRELAARYGGPCQLHEIDSLYGHDAFLKEGAQLGPILSAATRSDFHD